MKNNFDENKNEEWFNEIYKLYTKYVYEIIKQNLFSKIHDDITSCVQEVFIIAFVKIDMLRIHTDIKKWLRETSIRYSKNFNRSYLLRQQYYDELQDKDIESIASEENVLNRIIYEISGEVDIQANEVKRLLIKLSPDELKLYHLKYEQDLSNEEIGEIFHISAQNVATRNTRLIKKFKKMISGKK